MGLRLCKLKLQPSDASTLTFLSMPQTFQSLNQQNLMKVYANNVQMKKGKDFEQTEQQSKPKE